MSSKWKFKFLIGSLVALTTIALFRVQKAPEKFHEDVEMQNTSKRIEIDLNKPGKSVDSKAKEKANRISIDAINRQKMNLTPSFSPQATLLTLS